MDGLGQLVRDLAAGEHVEVPSEGIAGLAVEAVDLIGQLRAACDLSVRQRRDAAGQRRDRLGAHPSLAVAIQVLADRQHPMMAEGFGFGGRAAIPVIEETPQLGTGIGRADQIRNVCQTSEQETRLADRLRFETRKFERIDELGQGFGEPVRVRERAVDDLLQLLDLDLDEVACLRSGRRDQIVGAAIEPGGEIPDVGELEQQLVDIAARFGLGPLGEVVGDAVALQIHHPAEPVPAGAGHDVPDLQIGPFGLNRRQQCVHSGAGGQILTHLGEPHARVGAGG